MESLFNKVADLKVLESLFNKVAGLKVLESLFNKVADLESLFNKVADLKVWNFIEKRLQHRCFPVKFAKSFKNTHFEEHLLRAASGKLPLFKNNIFVKFVGFAHISGKSFSPWSTFRFE